MQRRVKELTQNTWNEKHKQIICLPVEIKTGVKRELQMTIFSATAGFSSAQVVLFKLLQHLAFLDWCNSCKLYAVKETK